MLQAGVVIGSGSASFEMLRYLTERLPVMVTPRWVHSRIQPIAVRDVLRYLVGCADLPDDVNRRFDIGGPDVLTYLEMMQGYATVAGLPRGASCPCPCCPRGCRATGSAWSLRSRRWPAPWWSRYATPSSQATTTSRSMCPTRRTD